MPNRWIVGIDPLDDMEQGYSQGEVDYIYEKSCDDSDCLCRNDFSWPDNIKDGCSKREGVER